MKSHVRTFGEKDKSRSVETIYSNLRWFRLLQTLVLKFFMVLKHMNCLLNVIIENFLKSHGRTFRKKTKVEVLKQSIQIWGALDCCRHLFWSFFYGFEMHELSFKCDYWHFSEISWPDITSKIELDGGGYRFDLINFFIWITLFPIDRYISK